MIDKDTLNRFTRTLFILTIFITGLCILVIELLGSRIIGPFFGVSLFVWTSIISVTLLSLSAGYWLGGLLADYKNDLSTFYLLISISAILIILIIPIKRPVLDNGYAKRSFPPVLIV